MPVTYLLTKIKQPIFAFGSQADANWSRATFIYHMITKMISCITISEQNRALL